MILKHPYWFFKDVIPHHVCDLIVKDCLNRKAKKSFKHESLPYPKRTNAE